MRLNARLQKGTNDGRAAATNVSKGHIMPPTECQRSIMLQHPKSKVPGRFGVGHTLRSVDESTRRNGTSRLRTSPKNVFFFKWVAPVHLTPSAAPLIHDSPVKRPHFRPPGWLQGKSRWESNWKNNHIDHSSVVPGLDLSADRVSRAKNGCTEIPGALPARKPQSAARSGS